jgi:phospholipid/cholesterol/gamma-HCH transport system permease protein
MAYANDSGQLELAGDWAGASLPGLDQCLAALPQEGDVQVHVGGVSRWDARLHALLLRLHRALGERGRSMQLLAAPETQQRLFELATAVPVYNPPTQARASRLSSKQLRSALADVGDDFLDSLAFLGATAGALLRTLGGGGDMRARELLGACFQSGPNALGIITLTSVLVGMILAYLGAAQLQQFGAAVYVADLVAIGMLREMGALMTAVVMAGRTGAAYAAQLSTMQTNEEIDAISTLGINPLDYLVVPRIIALVCMMPLLVVFSDLLGIVGGALVAGGMGVSPLQYLTQLESAISLSHFLVGIGKALVFALLIALAGCRAGMNAGRNSAAVGKATTEAVVTAVVYLIVADAAINILCQQLDI